MNNEALNKFNQYVKNIQISISEEMILERLKIRKRWFARVLGNTPSVQLINNLGSTETSLVFDIDGYLDYNKFIFYYNKGYSFIMVDVMDLFDSLRNITEIGKELLGINLSGNFYISKGQQQPSFDFHADDYNILVKNIYGECVWNIKEEEKINKCILKEQDILYLPTGQLHKVSTISNSRLSLTIALKTFI